MAGRIGNRGADGRTGGRAVTRQRLDGVRGTSKRIRQACPTARPPGSAPARLPALYALIALAGLACASATRAGVSLVPPVAVDSLDAVVLLVGDAGGPVSASGGVMAALSDEIGRARALSTMVLL